MSGTVLGAGDTTVNKSHEQRSWTIDTKNTKVRQVLLLTALKKIKGKEDWAVGRAVRNAIYTRYRRPFR